MSSMENKSESSQDQFEGFSRFHHPELPLNRSIPSQILIFFSQFIISYILYYYSARLFRGLDYLTIFSLNPEILLRDFPFHLWMSLVFGILLVKIFDRVPTISAILIAEYLLERIFSSNIQISLLLLLGFILIMFSIFPYKGGEFYNGAKIKRQLITYFGILLGCIPILFFGFQFTYNFTSEITLNRVRWFLLLNFSVQFFPVIIIHWGSMWLLDRFLVPFFPLSAQEKQEMENYLRNEETFNNASIESNNSLEIEDLKFSEKNHSETSSLTPESEDASNYDFLLPQPGEMYLHILTHHAIYNDNHTIVVQLGPVRLYLCTRCTAMILGALIGFFLTSFFLYDLNVSLNQTTTFWLGILLPILPLTDWGLQAIKIRPATNFSRLLTGFCLGLAMHFISISNQYMTAVLIIVAVYMAIFVVLMYFRAKLAKIGADEI